MNLHRLRSLILAAGLTCSLVPAFGQAPKALPPKPLDSLAALQTRFAEQLAQPRSAAAAWGIKIISLETGRTLFETNAHKLLKPASNAKLFTGALALDRLGPDFRSRTSLYASARPDAAGTLAGDLIVFGRGDPSLAARFHAGDYSQALDSLASALLTAGVKRIQGDLIGDESYFRGPPLGIGWSWDDLQNSYGAEVSALTVEDNVMDIILRPGRAPGEPCRLTRKPDTAFLNFINHTTTVAKGGTRPIQLYRPLGENTVHLFGSLATEDPAHVDAVAVHQPALWAVTLLKEALAKRGLTVAGKVRSVNWLERDAAPFDYSQLVEIAAVNSRPLSEILGKMLKPSQNLYAQLLLLQVGARTQKAATRQETTEDLGLRALASFLTEAGVNRGEVLLEEGSGLSRGGLVTPNATVTLLRHLARHRHAAVFRDALPIAGVDGTLRTRFKDTAAEKNVVAKTGTLRFVNALSGYATSAAKEPLAFSILLNNYSPSDPNWSGRAEVDALVTALASLTAHSGKAD